MKQKKHQIVEVAGNDLAIPFIEVGNGHPVTTVVCGVHGNERTPLLVVDKLLENLPDFEGTLRIVLFANPLASGENTRESNADRKDLNRIFPGNACGTIIERVAFSLVDLLKQSDRVVDLHTFDMETPNMGIVILSSNENVRNKSLDLMNVLSPEQVWVLNTGKLDERKFEGSLGFTLNSLEIPNIVLELENQEVVSEESIEKCIEGLKRILQGRTSDDKTTFFDRKVSTSNCEGVFIPCGKPFDIIKKGEIVGKVRNVLSRNVVMIKSDLEGVLMQVREKSFVNLGANLFAVGSEMSEEDLR